MPERQHKPPFSKGDIVLVLRDDSEEEEGGLIYLIEESGRVFIDYGGVVCLLHDEDQIRMAPENISEALGLNLKQNNEKIKAIMEKSTVQIREVLVDWRQNDTFLKWLKNSIKLKFDR